ncbi:DUF368 domain-containing protein [Lentibacillus kapialis]|uniref:DUF368 domain-containing protein n=1 Tax=Lentibacillus kapialis TaxID=340214 RepID=A0A917UW16_9BACI|nr:DUF368 domain-containing protein [Lentibacillus kapialis]GGJ90760.1 DUF368 domain-containing protein [Lentibacillus kapialis]
MEWKNIYRGMLMGASDVIPGVSGGTIAVLLGIYERLIAAINGIMTKDWKKQLTFLIPLGIGIITAIFLLSNVIKWLFKHYPEPTNFFFLGLILGVLPYLFHKADAKNKFQINHIILLLIGALIVGLLGFFQASEGPVVENLTASTYIQLFFSGFVASSALVLPGISGSLMLLILGMFSTIMTAISDLQLDVIAITGAGIVIGIVFMSKLVNFFLNNYYTGTFAVIIGMVIGSIFVVFPGWPGNISLVISSIVMFAMGLAAAYLLGKLEYE